MAHSTHLGEREVARVDRMWRPEGERPLLVSFYITELHGRIQCVGYSVRSFLFEDRPGELGFDAWAELPIPDPAADWDRVQAISRREGHTLPPRAWLDLGTPYQITASLLRGLPFGSLLTQAVRDYAAWAEGLPRRMDELLPGNTLREWFAEWALWDAAEEMKTATPVRRPSERFGRPSLVEVAERYAYYYQAGSPSPTRDVADWYRAPRSTVSKWISACRKQGHLAPTSRGRASGTPEEKGGRQ